MIELLTVTSEQQDLAQRMHDSCCPCDREFTLTGTEAYHFTGFVNCAVVAARFYEGRR